MPDFLPSELWTEILVRLPVRSLLTLKCVSKSFLTLIQNPNFAYLHFSRFNSPDPESNDSDLLLIERSRCITVCRGNTSTINPEFILPIEARDVVVGYVNGLLCLHSFNSPMKHMTLCNPSNRECLFIPPSPTFNLGRSNVGFGYDSLTQDYKAVAIVLVGSNVYNFQYLSSLIEVYSFKMGYWRSIGVDLFSREWFLGKSVYANGAVHWISGRHRCVYDHFDCNRKKFSHVTSFDLGSEVFSHTELPDCSFDRGCVCCHKTVKLLLSLHGSVAVLYVSNSYISIWVMEENGWRRAHMMESSSMLHCYLSNPCYKVADRINNVVFFEKSGELLIAVDDAGVILYNVGTKEYKKTHYCVSYVSKYVERLLWKELQPPSSPSPRLPLNQA